MNLGAEMYLASRFAKPEVVDSVCKRLNPEWIEEARRKIDAGESNVDQLSRLLAVVPTFSSYQLFRLRIATLTTSVNPPPAHQQSKILRP